MQFGHEPAEQGGAKGDAHQQFGGQGGLFPAAEQFAQPPGADQQDKELDQEEKNMMLTEKLHPSGGSFSSEYGSGCSGASFPLPEAGCG